MRSLSPAVAAVFDPVQAPTTFEETVERLGKAIRLALLPPGSRLPPERELAEQLGISRSTLRQALTVLTQTGHLMATRGRFGGTFVADHPPLTETAGVALEGPWRELLDFRVAVETGAAVLAAERATAQDLARLADPIAAMAAATDFAAYRRADVFFHLGLAEAAHAPRLVAAMTEVQAGMSELISHIAHPPTVLERSNVQHARIVVHLERREGVRAVRVVREHLEGTEHILAGLMPQAGGENRPG
jgi:GntR family transcriptional regulator, transcriptional repressor for pyruvate dehydrogenase complex